MCGLHDEGGDGSPYAELTSDYIRHTNINGQVKEAPTVMATNRQTFRLTPAHQFRSASPANKVNYYTLPPSCRMMTPEEYASLANNDHRICGKCQASAMHHCMLGWNGHAQVVCNRSWVVSNPSSEKGWDVLTDEQFNNAFQVT